MIKVVLLFLLMAFSLYAKTPFYYSGKEKVMLTPIKTISRSLAAYDFYEDARGVRLGVSKAILLGLSDASYLDSLLKEFHAKFIKDLGSGIYLIEVDEKHQTIEVANALHGREGVLFAHPDFLKQRRAR